MQIRAGIAGVLVWIRAVFSFSVIVVVGPRNAVYHQGSMQSVWKLDIPPLLKKSAVPPGVAISSQIPISRADQSRPLSVHWGIMEFVLQKQEAVKQEVVFYMGEIGGTHQIRCFVGAFHKYQTIGRLGFGRVEIFKNEGVGRFPFYQSEIVEAIGPTPNVFRIL